ncbi:UPF0223 family protein [Evansella clarkii]|uniref:UPF0223 family protein n=2 Tax=Evansella clarkii TaxID=79879 RepID=UPI003B84B59A
MGIKFFRGDMMKDENISIPISTDWSKEEIIDVVNFYEAVDQAYRKGTDRDTLLTLYMRFKKAVPGKSDEKRDFKEYGNQTGQSPYHAVKKAREAEGGTIIKM